MSPFSPCSIVTLNCNSTLFHLKRLAFSQFLNLYSPPIILLQETRIFTFTPTFRYYSYLYRPGLRWKEKLALPSFFITASTTLFTI